MLYIPIRFFFRDNFLSDSGPFNDKLGINAKRFPSNFNSYTIRTKYLKKN